VVTCRVGIHTGGNWLISLSSFREETTSQAKGIRKRTDPVSRIRWSRVCLAASLPAFSVCQSISGCRPKRYRSAAHSREIPPARLMPVTPIQTAALYIPSSVIRHRRILPAIRSARRRRRVMRSRTTEAPILIYSRLIAPNQRTGSRCKICLQKSPSSERGGGLLSGEGICDTNPARFGGDHFFV